MQRTLLGLVVLAASFALTPGARAQDVPPPPAAQVQVVEAPPAYAGPVVVAPTWGYDAPPPAALRAELAGLDAQIAQYSLGGPIVVTAVGGAGMGIGASFWMLYSLTDALTGDYGSERLASGIATLVGVGVLAAGLAWLFSNLGGRRPFTRRKREIILQLRAMGEQAYEPVLAPLFRF